jgi:cytidylate kinase
VLRAAPRPLRKGEAWTPPPAQVRLITLSREYGAGGSELGLLLGTELGWPVLDRDLAHRIAARLRCPAAQVERMGERTPSFLERVAATFSLMPPEASVLPDRSATLDPDLLVQATRAVLREAVRELPLIVVGHGGSCLFRDRPDVLRVRVTAPYDVRVRRVAERTGLPVHEAAADVRHRDADRRHYLERYYGCDANDPCLYDLQINTATVPLERAAGIVRAVVVGESG